MSAERDGLALLGSLDPSGAIEEAHEAAYGVTRGRLLRGAAFAGAGLLGLPAAARAADRGDVAILNFALTLEYLQAAFYTEAERRGALDGGLARQARVVGAHERAHVQAIKQVLGSRAGKKPTFDFRGTTEDPQRFRKTAVAFEDFSVAAYQDRAPVIASKAYLAAVAGILSVEARHASWIRLLAGVVPAPDAFDEPISPRRARKLVADTNFIVRRARTRGSSTPRFTG